MEGKGLGQGERGRKLEGGGGKNNITKPPNANFNVINKQKNNIHK